MSADSAGKESDVREPPSFFRNGRPIKSDSFQRSGGWAERSLAPFGVHVEVAIMLVWKRSGGRPRPRRSHPEHSDYRSGESAERF
jgi:hypothetical protein